MTLSIQFLTMVVMIMSGFYLGIALETFRRFSPLWRHRPVLVYMFEVGFWLIQTFIIFYVLYRVNAGALRVYVFLACLLGFAMYQALAASLYRHALEYIIRGLKRILWMVKRLYHLFIFTPISLFIHAVLWLVWLVLWVLIQVAFIAFLPLKWLVQMTHFMWPKKIKDFFDKKVDFYSILKRTCIKWVDSIKGR